MTGVRVDQIPGPDGRTESRLVPDPTAPKGASIKLPDERYGVLFVFRVFERVSYALVMHVTKSVSPLDVVQNP